jgi:hypothetical protein
MPELDIINDQLIEFIAGYAGFLSVAKGEVEIEPEDEEDAESLVFHGHMLLFASKGRVVLYREFLKKSGYKIDSNVLQFIEMIDSEVDTWLGECFNQVGEIFDEWLPWLLEAYEADYLQPSEGNNPDLGWNFDDFVEERDLIEFFILGIPDSFAISDFKAKLTTLDSLIKKYIKQLNLGEYSDAFFPDRVAWYPPSFWWHHNLTS